MKLASMRYKDFVWPHNPRAYVIEFGRRVVSHPIPGGSCVLQDMGRERRVLRGEGEFCGPTAYEDFKKLATVFYSDGPGVLSHPVWQASRAYFVELTLTQEPRADYVAYAFEFWEDGQDAVLTVLTAAETGKTASAAAPAKAEAEYHRVVSGDTLWAIAGRYSVSLPRLLELNPSIANPNFIYPGDLIRVG